MKKLLYLGVALMMVFSVPASAQTPPGPEDCPPEDPISTLAADCAVQAVIHFPNGLPLVPPDCHGNLPPLPDTQCPLEVWQSYLLTLDQTMINYLDVWYVEWFGDPDYSEAIPEQPLSCGPGGAVQCPGDTVPQGIPARGIFYYPWYPQNWGSGAPQSRFTPQAGYYDTAAEIPRQIDEMIYANQEFAVVSWYRCLPEGSDCPRITEQGQPPRSPRDERLEQMLLEADLDGRNFAVAPYYEIEGGNDPSVVDIKEDLEYLTEKYLKDQVLARNWLKIDTTNGTKPVIFVWADQETQPCGNGNPDTSIGGMVERYKSVGRISSRPGSIQLPKHSQFHFVLRVFDSNNPSGLNWSACETAEQFNTNLLSWHQYGPSAPSQNHSPESYVISPGYYHHGEATPRLTRDLKRFRENIRNQLTTNAQWMLTTTYNEWQEGTGVEPDQAFGSIFLDALATDGVEPGLQAKAAGAGDISCSPKDADNNGMPDGVPPEVDNTGCHMVDTANMVTNELNEPPATVPDLVLVPGDAQYEDGETEGFNAVWDPTWGQFQSVTYPAIGNHEYNPDNDGIWGGSDEDATPDGVFGDGYFNYFGGTSDGCSGSYTGNETTLPGPRRCYGMPAPSSLPAGQSEGVYRFSFGNWLFVALNSNCTPAGGCSDTSRQYARLNQWVTAWKATHPTSCEVVFWHHNRFSDGNHGSSDREDTDDGAQNLQHLFQKSRQLGVDLILVGHDHDYQRFPQMKQENLTVIYNGVSTTKNMGVADPEFGTRYVVVGTGGKNSTGVFTDVNAGTPTRNCNRSADTQACTQQEDIDPEAHNGSSFGVFDMELRPNDATFTWTADPDDLSTVTGEVNSDSFNLTCHN